MKIFSWIWVKKLRGLLAMEQEPVEQAERIVSVQRNVVLPSKAGICLVVLYYLFYSGWLDDASATRSVAMDMLKQYFLIYLLCNAVGTLLFASWQRLPPALFQWVAFTMGLLDGLFVAGITIVTGGFGSIAFWLFPALIVVNSWSIRLAMPQIVLNLLLSGFYLGAVLLTPHLGGDESAIRGLPGRNTGALRATNSPAPESPRATAASATTPAHAGGAPPRSPRRNIWPESPTEPLGGDVVTEQLILQLSVLWLLTVCCYGAQVLLERQRLALIEAAEFAAREGQLHSAGRLAAEFAHRLKNPLAIINNTAYSLQRSLRDKPNAAQQIEIIQEEVARADKVITQVMGYAQLSEGRVEKLKVVEEVDRAISQVFPEAVPTGIELTKRLAGPFPPLLMQRGHLSEILVNLLSNARDALNGHGHVSIVATVDRQHTVEISVADDGPGIPADRLGRVFEAYFTTKEKGTGLGLAIVKHNVELYSGNIKVDSELGKGAKFTVTFPAKLQPKPFIK
ncbi:MAG TPA: HAMP domain-containing sensor histidine kinase [Verrucomicrobiae bacterium]